MIWLPYFLVVVYSSLILALVYYWQKIPVIVESKRSVFVSIIVPVRNEAANIGKTLSSVLACEYAIDNYEILVINDHSEDNTVDVVNGIKHSNIILHNLSEGERGKKKAITYGIDQAKGQLVLCTDGDTQVGKHWINCHADSYVQGAKISFGSVKYSSSNYYRYLNLELSALVTIGGVTASLGHPSMINGCNYSFDKKAFYAVKGFQGNIHLPSGDDEFLLRKIHAEFTDSIAFLKSNNAVVFTKSPDSFREFYDQRRRWASKWKSHKGVRSKLMPIAVFCFYLSVITLYFEAVFFGSIIALVLSAIKVLVDLLLMKKGGLITFGIRDIIPFFALQIIYPFYAVFFGLASNFGRYEWRGRVYRI